jgi:aerobic-type carbon monoxide dehydrogenase small subunit (CoxS/CutS family)
VKTVYRFTVNGRPAETDRDMPLIDYLRDELRLTSVKNGCGEAPAARVPCF